MRFLFFLILVSAACAAEKSEPYIYEKPATLTGTVKNDKMFYGPPGYGENPKVDEKETPERLILDQPIDIDPEPGDKDSGPVKAVTELQIVPNEVPDLKPYLGQRVKVTGKMFQAHTGHHHTKALIALDAIELEKKPGK